MDYPFELTGANRLQLAHAFQKHKRVDFSIDCVIEGQMGRAFVDNLSVPTAFRITVGPFSYFAGDASGERGHQMLRELPAYGFLMPGSADWLKAAQELYKDNLYSFTRYSFSSAALSVPNLESIIAASPFRDRVVPLDLELATHLAGLPDTYLDLADYDSVRDFIARGLSFVVVDHNRVLGVAFSSLVCSQGIEVSVFVPERYRRQGVATAVASKLVCESLKRGLRPNWDAANPESCKLALKLGYAFVQEYQAYYHTPGRAI